MSEVGRGKCSDARLYKVTQAEPTSCDAPMMLGSILCISTRSVVVLDLSQTLVRWTIPTFATTPLQ